MKKRTRSDKRQVSSREPTANEKHLEEFLFGKDIIASDSYIKQLDAAEDENEASAAVDFVIDTAPGGTAATGDEAATGEAVAVWYDDDDDEVEVDLNHTNRLKKLKTVDEFNNEVDTLVTGAELSSRLRQRFIESNATKWATVKMKQSGTADSASALAGIDEEDLAVLRHAGSSAVGKAKYNRNRAENGAEYPLPSSVVSVKRLVNANAADPSSARINSLDFHHNGELLMLGGEDKHLKFFKIDGERNEKQMSIKLKDMRISEARFVGQSANTVLAGRKPYYYTYDTEHGRLSKILARNPSETRSLEHMTISPQGSFVAFRGEGGYIHVSDGYRHQWTHRMKMNTLVRSMTFLDETHVASSGLDADIYIWDLRKSGRCIARFAHEDGSCTSALSSFVPPTEAINFGYRGFQLPQSYLAVGTESGVVSIYGEEPDNVSGSFSFINWDYHPRSNTTAQMIEATSNKKETRQTPIKTVFNLTTKITTTVFHPSGQLLAMASEEKRNQLKLVHLPSMTVFANWPTDHTPLNRITSMTFSNATRGGLFAIGNNQGKVLLYRLEHFGAA